MAPAHSLEPILPKMADCQSAAGCQPAVLSAAVYGGVELCGRSLPSTGVPGAGQEACPTADSSPSVVYFGSWLIAYEARSGLAGAGERPAIAHPAVVKGAPPPLPAAGGGRPGERRRLQSVHRQEASDFAAQRQ